MDSVGGGTANGTEGVQDSVFGCSVIYGKETFHIFQAKDLRSVDREVVNYASKYVGPHIFKASLETRRRERLAREASNIDVHGWGRAVVSFEHILEDDSRGVDIGPKVLADVRHEIAGEEVAVWIAQSS